MNIPKYIQGSDGIHRVEFDSVGHLLEVACATGEGYNSRSTELADYYNGRTDSWVNHFSRDKVLQSMVHCPDHLVTAVDSVKRAIEDDISVPYIPRRKRRSNLEDGEELDPEAWVQRRTDGWTDILSEKIVKPIIRIGVNIVVHCGLKAQHVIHRGAAAIALTDLLSQQGHSVELSVFTSETNFCKTWSRGSSLSVIAKHSDTPLDMGAACMACAEIAYFRLGVIPAQCRCCPESHSSACGFPCMLFPADHRGMDIILDADNFTYDQAVFFVKNKMAEFKTLL